MKLNAYNAIGFALWYELTGLINSIREELFCIDSYNTAEAIHNVRVFTKRSCALLELASPTLPNTEINILSANLKKISNCFSAKRDQHVQQVVHNKLQQKKNQPHLPPKQPSKPSTYKHEDLLKSVVRALEILEIIVQSGYLKKLYLVDHMAVLENIQLQHDKTSAIINTLAVNDSLKNYHRVRKEIKKLFYQLEWHDHREKNSSELIGILRVAGSLLGSYHDYGVFIRKNGCTDNQKNDQTIQRARKRMHKIKRCLEPIFPIILKAQIHYYQNRPQPIQ